jgi:hypothetical protein
MIGWLLQLGLDEVRAGDSDPAKRHVHRDCQQRCEQRGSYFSAANSWKRGLLRLRSPRSERGNNHTETQQSARQTPRLPRLVYAPRPAWQSRSQFERRLRDRRSSRMICFSGEELSADSLGCGKDLVEARRRRSRRRAPQTADPLSREIRQQL